MKKLIFILIAAVFFGKVNGQNQAYSENMSNNLQKYATAQSVADWQAIANQFDRIANVEKKEWLPLYYAAQAALFMSFQEQDKTKVDAYLDQAQKYLDRAVELKSDDSEINVLQGFLYLARIGVDPMGRGQSYSMQASASFEKAKQINPENPRVYYMQAMTVMNTPEQFGGGKKNALPIFETAKEKFEKFVPESQLSPNWGKENNLEQLELCMQ